MFKLLCLQKNNKFDGFYKIIEVTNYDKNMIITLIVG